MIDLILRHARLPGQDTLTDLGIDPGGCLRLVDQALCRGLVRCRRRRQHDAQQRCCGEDQARAKNGNAMGRQGVYSVVSRQAGQSAILGSWRRDHFDK